MRCALFVDLPNFYSHLLESGIDDQRVLRDYFLYYCDFDRLAQHLTGEATPVWVFHSNQRFGPKSNRIQDEYLRAYIDRINKLRGVTARNVDIPGEQREPVSYQCENCNHEGRAQWVSEKGIDTSLTVHLFDTIDSWDVAYLLSGDADFVPCVASLRRRGKLVTGVGFKNASSALVRECYDYVDLGTAFIREDVVAYRLFMQDGIISHWLNGLVTHVDGSVEDGDEVTFYFTYEYQPNENRKYLSSVRDNLSGVGFYLVNLSIDGMPDLSTRKQKIEVLQEYYSSYFSDLLYVSKEFMFAFSPDIWFGVRQRLVQLLSSLELTKSYNFGRDGKGYFAKYRYKAQEDQYVLVME